MFKKYIYFIPFAFIFIIPISFWIFPTAAPSLGITSILLSLLVLGTALDFGLEMSDWKEPIKDNLNNWWDVNMNPVVESVFNQPVANPAQPAISNPIPPTAPASTPTPNEINQAGSDE